MSNAQLACLLAAAPFLALSIIWLVGTTILAVIGDEQ